MAKLMATINSIFLVLCFGFFGCSSIGVQEKTVALPTQKSSELSKRSPANHTWNGYHWARTTAQFTLKLGDNLTSNSWKAFLTQSSSDWNSPQLFGATNTPLMTAVVVGSSGSRRCEMVAGTTQVCNAKYGNNGWLGLASINIVNGNHITQGSAKMNDTYFNNSTYNNENEKRHVMCQEVAHTFGLDHQSTDGSSLNTCMDYFSNTGVNATSTASTRPNAHDFEELGAMYLALDTTSTLAASSVLSTATDITDDPKSWGDFLGERSHGQSAYYEKANHDGSKTITHVYWTLETAKKCRDCDHRFNH